MAYAAKLSSLSEDLIVSLTGLSTQSRAFKPTKERTLRSLKSHPYGRTNQFDVQNQLKGLLEKFEVKGNDELAAALSTRLHELGDPTTKWHPEILAFLLELSDRPLEKASLEALDSAQGPEKESQLTWEEIIADDPLDEEGIWDDIDYAAGSSGDEVVEDEKPTPPSQNKKHAEENEVSPVISDSIFLHVDEELLEQITKSQFWSSPRVADRRSMTSQEPASRTLTELQAIRETIHMILGLPTSLFRKSKDGYIEPNPVYSITEAHPATFHDMLYEIAEIGSSLHYLRQWLRIGQIMPLLQTFQNSIHFRIRTFDKAVTTLEADLLVPTSPLPVSLIKTCTQLRSLSVPIMTLSTLVSSLPANCPPFTCLELLHVQISIAQLSNDLALMSILADIFFATFSTYLHSVRTWMDSGAFLTSDSAHPTFFIEQDPETPLADLWHKRYTLRTTDDGKLYAPSFLTFAIRKILNTGKSVAFLRELGYHPTPGPQDAQEPALTYTALYPPNDAAAHLASFPDAFSAAFERWMQSKFSSASTELRRRLEVDCGLSRTLDAMDLLFFSKDGSAFQSFADVAIEKVERGRLWRERGMLAETASSVFSQLPSIDIRRLRVDVSGTENEVLGLDSIILSYTLPWPLLSILRPSTLQTYQQVFTLLLKIYRAKHALRSLTTLLSPLSPVAAKRSRLPHLRLALTHATDILHEYVTTTVLAYETAQLRAQLENAEDLDAMCDIHTAYIASLEAQCLLVAKLKPIRDAVLGLLELGGRFVEAVRGKVEEEMSGGGAVAEDLGRSTRRLPRKVDGGGESSGDEEDEDAAAPSEVKVGGKGERVSFDAEVRDIEAEFARLTGFVVAGLKGVSRAGGQRGWVMFAERLDWKRGREKEGGIEQLL